MPPRSNPAPTPPTDASWFGHPRQLARLFSTELWERFGYYGMRAILALYLAQHYLFRDQVTNGLYGAFTALVYLTPLFGGLLADRFLGSKRSVKFGALLMSLGYLGLSIDGQAAKPYMQYEEKRYDIVSQEVIVPVDETSPEIKDDAEPEALAGHRRRLRQPGAAAAVAVSRQAAVSPADPQDQRHSQCIRFQ